MNATVTNLLGAGKLRIGIGGVESEAYGGESPHEGSRWTKGHLHWGALGKELLEMVIDHFVVTFKCWTLCYEASNNVFCEADRQCCLRPASLARLGGNTWVHPTQLPSSLVLFFSPWKVSERKVPGSSSLLFLCLFCFLLFVLGLKLTFSAMRCWASWSYICL